MTQKQLSTSPKAVSFKMEYLVRLWEHYTYQAKVLLKITIEQLSTLPKAVTSKTAMLVQS